MVEARSDRTIAAPRQKLMKLSATVVATTTLVEAETDEGIPVVAGCPDSEDIYRLKNQVLWYL